MTKFILIAGATIAMAATPTVAGATGTGSAGSTKTTSGGLGSGVACTLCAVGKTAGNAVGGIKTGNMGKSLVSVQVGGTASKRNAALVSVDVLTKDEKRGRAPSTGGNSGNGGSSGGNHGGGNNGGSGAGNGGSGSGGNHWGHNGSAGSGGTKWNRPAAGTKPLVAVNVGTRRTNRGALISANVKPVATVNVGSKSRNHGSLVKVNALNNRGSLIKVSALNGTAKSARTGLRLNANLLNGVKTGGLNAADCLPGSKGSNGTKVKLTNLNVAANAALKVRIGGK